MEGDDQQDPVVDTVRSLLDGHIVLDRELAARNHYPPISILDSLSRLMPSITTAEHLQKVRSLRLLLSAHARSEDLIRIGAYQHGSDPTLDKAIASLPATREFLQQGSKDRAPLAENIKRLMELPS
jgi:flagellum-specific ATP synthase